MGAHNKGVVYEETEREHLNKADNRGRWSGNQLGKNKEEHKRCSPCYKNDQKE